MTKYFTKLKIQMLQKNYNTDVVILVALIEKIWCYILQKSNNFEMCWLNFLVFYLSVPINVV